MYLKTNKIMKNIDVVFMKNRTSVGNDLEMCPSERNEAPMMVGMDKYSKASLFDHGEDIEECDERMEDNQVPVQETREEPISRKCSSTPPSHTNHK